MANFRVRKRKFDTIQKLLKRYKNKFSEFEIRQELIKRRYYEKPTTIRRKQKMDAIREQQLLDKQYKEENHGLR